MNSDTIEGKWEQVKGRANQLWSKLGQDDFALLAKGKMQEFSGKVQETYGKSKEDAEKEIRDFEKSCGCTSSKWSDDKAA